MKERRKILHRESGNQAATQRLGPYAIESLVEVSEEGAITAYRVRVEPNQTTNVSYHKIAEEIYFVLSGSGTAILDGEPFVLKAGDFLRLPPGTTHGFVTGDEPLEMLDLHTPGCRPNHDVYFVGDTPAGFTVNE